MGSNDDFDLPLALDNQRGNPRLRATSTAVWSLAAARLSPARKAVFQSMRTLTARSGPPTASEIAEHVGSAGGRCVWKRVGELVKMGHAVECAPRPCSVTSHTVLTYRSKS